MFRTVLASSARNAVNSILKPSLKRKQFTFSPTLCCPCRLSPLGKNHLILVSYCSLSRFAISPNHADDVNSSEANSTQSERYPILENTNLKEIAQNDDELLQKLEKAVAAMRDMAKKGYVLPSHMDVEDWHELISNRSFRSKTKFLKHLFIKERRKKKDKERQEKERKNYEEFLKQKPLRDNDPERISYGLEDNSLFLRIYSANMDKFYNFRAFQSMMFGPTIIIDCSYNEFMVTYEIKSCVSQFLFLVGCNRSRSVPLNYHFVNFDTESALAKRFLMLNPILYEPHYPFNWSSKSYIDLYPKEKLVYLTPHCEETLDAVNHDDIYIIGAMVDKGISEPLSLMKAKKAGIRYAKLPLDDHVNWGFGTKSLTIDQCGNIVSDALLNSSWEEAFKLWVPSRKLKKPTVEDLEFGMKHQNSVHHLKINHRRNSMLYEYILREEEGEKGRYMKGPWPL